jgi:Tfp pilus assembly protein PilZ
VALVESLGQFGAEPFLETGFEQAAELRLGYLMYLTSGELYHPTSVIQNLGDDLTRRAITLALNDYNISIAVKTEDVYATPEVGGMLRRRQERA